MNYTKGDWKYSEDREGNPCIALYFSGQRSRVHAIIARVYGKDKSKAKANAHLIAASPRMADLLQRLVIDGWNASISEEATEILRELKPDVAS